MNNLYSHLIIKTINGKNLAELKNIPIVQMK